MTDRNNTNAVSTSTYLDGDFSELIAQFGPYKAPEVVYIRDFKKEPPEHPSPNVPFMLVPVAVDLNGEPVRKMGKAYPWEVARWAVYCEQNSIDWKNVAWRYKREAKIPMMDKAGNPLLNEKGEQRHRSGKLIFELAE